MRVVMLMLLCAAACGDNQKPALQDGGVSDAAQPLAACLDRPTELARPPANQLPCELLPPGFGVP